MSYNDQYETVEALVNDSVGVQDIFYQTSPKFQSNQTQPYDIDGILILKQS